MSAKEAPTIAILSRAHSPTSVERIHSEKIQHRPLFLKPSEPTSTNPTARQQRHLARVHKLEKRRKRLNPAPLTAKEKRASQIYAIPKTGQKYEIFEALHGMWEAYIREVLFDGHGGQPSSHISASTAAKLVSADYHGAELEVVRSKCVSRVGVKGIVVKETKFTFEIITRNNVIKQIPKEGTVFRFELLPNPAVSAGTEGVEKSKDGPTEGGPVDGKDIIMGTDREEQKVGIDTKPLVFDIYGCQFLTRSSDRAVRKFKPHYFPEL